MQFLFVLAIIARGSETLKQTSASWHRVSQSADKTIIALKAL